MKHESTQNQRGNSLKVYLDIVTYISGYRQHQLLTAVRQSSQHSRSQESFIIPFVFAICISTFSKLCKNKRNNRITLGAMFSVRSV
jgi:hypothetical protein